AGLSRPHPGGAGQGWRKSGSVHAADDPLSDRQHVGGRDLPRARVGPGLCREVVPGGRHDQLGCGRDRFAGQV
ncbi:hypothetical protein H2201_009417, partial [Coniosporium apollinis]